MTYKILSLILFWRKKVF